MVPGTEKALGGKSVFFVLWAGHRLPCALREDLMYSATGTPDMLVLLQGWRDKEI